MTPVLRAIKIIEVNHALLSLCAVERIIEIGYGPPYKPRDTVFGQRGVLFNNLIHCLPDPGVFKYPCIEKHERKNDIDDNVVDPKAAKKRRMIIMSDCQHRSQFFYVCPMGTIRFYASDDLLHNVFIEESVNEIHTGL
jgi:hypothetical protein